MLRGERIRCSEERGRTSLWTGNQTRLPGGEGLSAWHLGKQGNGALGKSLGMCRDLVCQKTRRKTPVASTLQFIKPGCGHLCCWCSQQPCQGDTSPILQKGALMPRGASHLSLCCHRSETPVAEPGLTMPSQWPVALAPGPAQHFL